jgi:FKBP-type peptidyl-prolyl cis-trans isomerase 2
MSYGPVRICIGQSQILPGLDAHLEGLEIGKETELTLPPEHAFGRKDGKLMKLVPTNIFKKQGINPVTGLQVNIDGSIGTIRTVTGGRTVVDFNHPFAGKEVIYKVTIRRVLTDEKEKVISLMELALNQKKEAIDVDIKDGNAIVTLKQDFPEQLLALIKERITTLLSSIKEVEFRTPGEAKKQENKQGPEGKQEDKEDAPEAGKTA